jgi:hypothetical protein
VPGAMRTTIGHSAAPAMQAAIASPVETPVTASPATIVTTEGDICFAS